MTANEFAALPSPFASKVAGTAKRAFSGVPPVSFKRVNIAGLLVTVYGLEKVSNRNDVACLFLLHGRLEWQDPMGHVAAAFINSWSAQRRPSQKSLICVAFDQRNHGSRLVSKVANTSWLDGNSNHAVDMWTLYNGTAQDVSMLITHLPTYIQLTPSTNICSGVSLGGHASWQCVIADPRINAAIIVVGCPDYARLMSDRAIRNKRESALGTDPPGKNFFGSTDFPASLLSEIDKYDPAGIFCGRHNGVTAPYPTPSQAEAARLKPLLQGKLSSKSILVLTGGKDKLVPYTHTEPFLTWLKTAIDPQSGWCNDQAISLTDFVDPDGKHEFSPAMRSTAEEWLACYLSQKSSQSSVM